MTRTETLAGRPGERRSLRVRVLYPALAGQPATRMLQASEEVYDAM